MMTINDLSFHVAPFRLLLLALFYLPIESYFPLLSFCVEQSQLLCFMKACNSGGNTAIRAIAALCHQEWDVWIMAICTSSSSSICPCFCPYGDNFSSISAGTSSSLSLSSRTSKCPWSFLNSSSVRSGTRGGFPLFAPDPT